MKWIFLCFFLMCMSGKGLCQRLHAVQWEEYERLLRKGNRQQAAGLVLTLGGGAALGLTIFLNLGEPLQVVGSPAAASRRKSLAPPLLMSGAALVGGLILLVASDRNKDCARRVRYSLKPEHTNQLHAYTVSSYYYPCLSVTIKL